MGGFPTARMGPPRMKRLRRASSAAHQKSSPLSQSPNARSEAPSPRSLSRRWNQSKVNSAN